MIDMSIVEASIIFITTGIVKKATIGLCEHKPLFMSRFTREV
ncbi:hypothetical protein ABEW19_05205 [Paenibacillus illinoisensis]